MYTKSENERLRARERERSSALQELQQRNSTEIAHIQVYNVCVYIGVRVYVQKCIYTIICMYT